MKLTDRPVWCLMGPTAAGKTHVAIELAQHFPCDLISVDSAMVYRGLDIGTAKPSQETLLQYPHRLIDCCDPSEAYSTGRFVTDALSEINKSHQAQRIPLLVGGTMLYFHALQKGLASLPTADQDVRHRIQNELAKQGLSGLYEKLKTIDPQATERIHAHDSQRIQRALEVYYVSGETLTEHWQKQTAWVHDLTFINLIVMPGSRHVLHQSIAERWQTMLAQGFLEEVKALYDCGTLTDQTPAMRTVGYRQAWAYYAGYDNLDTMQAKALAATRQLAKRQITWLRRWSQGQCFKGKPTELAAAVAAYLTQ